MKIILFYIVGFMAQIGFSQQKDINVYIIKAELYKRFDKKDSSIRLTIKINDLIIDSNNWIRLKKITKAVTSNRKNLKHEAIFMGDDFVNTNNLIITFKNPTEKVKNIALLQGVFEYFQVSKKNSSLFTTTNILNKYHTNLVKDSLLGVKLMLIDETYFLKLRETDKNKCNKAMLALKNKEKLGKTIDYFFNQFFSKTPLLDKSWKDYYKDKLVFYIKDVHHSFFDIKLFDNQGERIDLGYSINQTNHQLIVRLKKGEKSLGKNLILDVKLKNKKAIKELKFTIKNINLLD